MKKVLLTGGKGMLGRTLCAELTDFEVIPTDLPEADITDPARFDALLKKFAPDAVIHCAAMTAVDKCESEIDLAFRLNAFGTANVAAACHRNGIRLIAISTDYVFDGTGHVPYSPDDETNPVSVYGKTKRDGEIAVLENAKCPVVIRTAWLYSVHGNNFVKTKNIKCNIIYHQNIFYLHKI